MSSHQKWFRRFFFNLKFACARDEPLLRFRSVPFIPRNPIGISTERISFRDSIEQVKLASPCQPSKCAVADFAALFIELTWLQVVAYERDDLRTHVVTVKCVHVQTIKKTLGWRNARFFVSTRTP